MADQLRDRDVGICADEPSVNHYEEMSRNWLGAACSQDNIAPIVELVTLHYKGGKQKPIKLHDPIRGSFNTNWRVEFEEGSAILHVPAPGATAFSDEKIRAEVAAMKMIEAKTTIPVPHIYHWGYAADNPTGLGPFIIMDYIEHDKTRSDLLVPVTGPPWNINRRGIGPGVSEGALLEVYRQMANILLQLSTPEMSCIGSLSFDERSKIFQVQGRPITQNTTEMVVGGGNPRCALPSETKTFAKSKECYSALSDSEYNCPRVQCCISSATRHLT
jgi:hypothetical protein